jgi:ribosomal protein L29
MPSQGTTEAAAQPMGTEMPAQAGPPVEGKRTQLKIVRENIQALAGDIGNFRRSHQTSVARLEKQIASLKKELASQTVSKDVGSLMKSHDASTRKLEKQVSTLRAELASLKSGIAKDAARNRAKQEAILNKILAKVSVKPKPAKPAKSAKKR